jgi:Phytanoyl-CoA dioxygenase (PhyH)
MSASEESTAADAVIHVQRLARAGLVERAIGYAMAKNGQFKDGQLAHQLMRLRYASFSPQSAKARPDWPPQYPDVFSGQLTPEIRASELNAGTLGAGILHHGCVIVRALASRSHTLRLTEQIDRAISAREALSRSHKYTDNSSWYFPFQPNRAGYLRLNAARAFAERGGSVLAADSPAALCGVIEFFESRGVIDVISEFLGERPALSVQKTVLRRVSPTTRADWHQDGAFMGGAQVRAVNVWLALSACGVDAPGLDIVPRRLSHIVETGKHGARFGWSAGQHSVDAAAGSAEFVTPTFAPGDALIFDQFLLHRTGGGPNMMQHRYAIESWFFAPSHFPSQYYGLPV